MAKVKESPWVLHYDGSSCNGCDIEVLASLTPVYDAERFGIVNTGDPLQADILLITGGINTQNVSVVKQLYDQMPRRWSWRSAPAPAPAAFSRSATTSSAARTR